MSIFFTPVVIKYMEKNFDITKPRHSEQIFQVPWPYVISRFHCTIHITEIEKNVATRKIVCYAAEVRQRLQAGNKATSQKTLVSTKTHAVQ